MLRSFQNNNLNCNSILGAREKEGEGVGQRERGRVHGLFSPERCVGEGRGVGKCPVPSTHAHRITQGRSLTCVFSM